MHSSKLPTKIGSILNVNKTIRQKVLNCGAGFQPATAYRAGRMPAPQYMPSLNDGSHFLPERHSIMSKYKGMLIKENS